MDSTGASVLLASAVATGLWEGAALYSTLCNVPYLSETKHPAPELLREWRRWFPSAMAMQKSLVMLGIASNGLAAWTNKDSDVAVPFAVSGAAQLAIFAYTMAKIMPVNKQLLEGGKAEKEGDAKIRSLLVLWGEMHGVRTLLGGVAFGASLWGIHMLLTRK